MSHLHSSKKIIIILFTFFKLSIPPGFINSDANYYSILLSLTIWILYFDHSRGVMKIRFAVNLADLGLLLLSQRFLFFFLQKVLKYMRDLPKLSNPTLRWDWGYCDNSMFKTIIWIVYSNFVITLYELVTDIKNSIGIWAQDWCFTVITAKTLA